MKQKFYLFLIFLLVGWLLFFFGGWHLSLSKKMDDVGKIYTQNIKNIGLNNVDSEDFQYIFDVYERPKAIANKYGFLVRVGKSYVGFVTDSRFIGIPILQWIMLIISIGFFVNAFSTLFENDEEEEEDASQSAN